MRTAAAPPRITKAITINGAIALPSRRPRSGGWEVVTVLDRGGGAAAAVEEVTDVVCEAVDGGRAGFVAWRRGFDEQHNF